MVISFFLLLLHRAFLVRIYLISFIGRLQTIRILHCSPNLSFSAASSYYFFFSLSSFVISSMCTMFYSFLFFWFSSFICFRFTYFVLINLYVRCVVFSLFHRHSSEISAAALVSKWKFTLFLHLLDTNVYSQLHFDVAISSGFYVFYSPLQIDKHFIRAFSILVSLGVFVCNTFICAHLTRCDKHLFYILQMHFYVVIS